MWLDEPPAVLLEFSPADCRPKPIGQRSSHGYRAATGFEVLAGPVALALMRQIRQARERSRETRLWAQERVSSFCEKSSIELQGDHAVNLSRDTTTRPVMFSALSAVASSCRHLECTRHLAEPTRRPRQSRTQPDVEPRGPHGRHDGVQRVDTRTVELLAPHPWRGGVLNRQ